MIDLAFFYNLADANRILTQGHQSATPDRILTQGHQSATPDRILTQGHQSATPYSILTQGHKSATPDRILTQGQARPSLQAVALSPSFVSLGRTRMEALDVALIVHPPAHQVG